MAECWLAQDEWAQDLVLKRLPIGRREDHHLKACLADEGRIAAALDHPNIARLLDRFWIDRELILVYEYVPGSTLWHLCRQAQGVGTGLPVDLVLSLGLQLAEALNHAHRRRNEQGQPLNIIHRDVSPQNVMVDSQGRARLLDFGVALAESNQRATAGGALYGHLGYASPELATGQTMTPAADQFSLGVLLWECLARRRLFGVGSPAQVIGAVARAEIPALRGFCPRLDNEICTIIERSLARAPNQRFATCGDLAEALRSVRDRLALQPVCDASYRTWRKDLGRGRCRPRRLPASKPSRPWKKRPLLQLRSLLDRIRLLRGLRDAGV